jgi:hypothetical protein
LFFIFLTINLIPTCLTKTSPGAALADAEAKWSRNPGAPIPGAGASPDGRADAELRARLKRVRANTAGADGGSAIDGLVETRRTAAAAAAAAAAGNGPIPAASAVSEAASANAPLPSAAAAKSEAPPPGAAAAKSRQVPPCAPPHACAAPGCACTAFAANPFRPAICRECCHAHRAPLAESVAQPAAEPI